MTWLTMNSGNDLVRRKCIKKSPFVYKGYCQLMCSISGTVRRAEINKNVFFSSWAKFFFLTSWWHSFFVLFHPEEVSWSPCECDLANVSKAVTCFEQLHKLLCPRAALLPSSHLSFRPRINRLIENKHLNPGTILI